MCAVGIENCNATHEEATLSWWSDMRKLIVRTHADHRNNVIKTMRLRFIGKYKYYCYIIANIMSTMSSKLVCVKMGKMETYHTSI